MTIRGHLFSSGFLALTALVGAVSSGCDRKAPEGSGSTPAPAVSSAGPSAVGKGVKGTVAFADAGPADRGKVEFPEVPIKAGTTTTVHVKWKAPEGTGVNEDAPFRVRWHKSDALESAPADVKGTGSAAKDGFDIAVKPLGNAPNATLGGGIDLVVCDVETHNVCVPVHRSIDIDFVVGNASATETTVTVPLPQARPRG